jgi:hypothetical protein
LLTGMWESASNDGEQKANMLDSMPAGSQMFNDLFHLVHSLDHDIREEDGERIHSITCRRCAISLRLNTFKAQILKVLRDIDFGVGDSDEKNRPY